METQATSDHCLTCGSPQPHLHPAVQPEIKRSLAERIVGGLLWLLCRERHEIGRLGLDRYLTRWTLLGRRKGDGAAKLFLHCFHRGDAEPYAHNHPWNFWSLILSGGYWEWTPCETPEQVEEARKAGELIEDWLSDRAVDFDVLQQLPIRWRRRWYGPLSLLRRPAEWKHRVELPEGKRCWTLIWCGKKVRSWGFWCPLIGWIHWKQHEANQLAGKAGCGEDH